LYFPTSVAVDGAGNLFIADSADNRVRKVSADGTITTVAGNGTSPPAIRQTADGGPATGVPILASHVMVDGAGILYISEDPYADVRKVLPDGTIRTAIASPSGSPYSGVNTATTVDRDGNLFVAGFLCNGDACSLSIRKVSAAGVITTLTAGSPLFSPPSNGDIGDGGPVNKAQLGFVSALTVDSAGNLFLGDLFGERVRRIGPDGIITTVGGNGLPGYSGDGGPAAKATLDTPMALAVDGTGNVYVSDFNQSVRLLRPVVP